MDLPLRRLASTFSCLFLLLSVTFSKYILGRFFHHPLFPFICLVYILRKLMTFGLAQQGKCSFSSLYFIWLLKVKI